MGAGGLANSTQEADPARLDDDHQEGEIAPGMAACTMVRPEDADAPRGPWTPAPRGTRTGRG